VAYRIAAIDIHKKVLMVVVATAADQTADPAGEALKFECRRFGAGNSERMHIVSWLQQKGVSEVVMESTAQYWKPVWLDLEPHFPKLHLAQAQSNRAPRGRKNDFKDAKRLARRLLADELMLSFVPEAEQRMWRTLTRSRQQLVRDRVRLQNQVEALLEEMRIKLSGVISDLFGVSGRRILTALAQGETDARKLAEMGDPQLKCSKEELADALSGSSQPLQRQVLTLFLERLKIFDQQIERLEKMVAEQLHRHEQAVIRIAQIPGFGVNSAQQIIAEVGPDVSAFPTADAFCSWIGCCPGTNESAQENQSSRSPKGNRFVRRILSEAAQAAVRTKNCRFQQLFKRFLPRLGYPAAVWAVAHRLARVLWKLLRDGVPYVELTEQGTPQSRKRRAQKLLKDLRKLGYTVTIHADTATICFATS
jgi:transposase